MLNELIACVVGALLALSIIFCFQGCTGFTIPKVTGNEVECDSWPTITCIGDDCNMDSGC